MSDLNPQTPNHAHPNGIEPAKDPFDEFSFDDLMQLDTAPSTPAPHSSTPAAPHTAHEMNMDFDEMFGFDEPAVTSHTANGTPAVDLAKHPDTASDTQQLSPQHELSNEPHSFSDPFTEAFASPVADVPTTHTSEAFATPVTNNLTPANNLTPTHTATSTTSNTEIPESHLHDTTGINPVDMVAGVATGVTAAAATTAASAAAAVKPKGGLFGKKEKAPPANTTNTQTKPAKPAKAPLFGKKPAVTTTAPLTPVATKKKRNLLPLLLGLLLLGGLGAWLFNQIANKAEDVPVATKPIAAKPVAAPVAHPASAPLATTTVTKTNVSSAPSTTATASATSAPLATATTKTSTTTTVESTAKPAAVIKPEEILAAEVPKDPAIAKEEMDKLADQSKRLEEQEAMIQDQLKMMNQLSDKKAERIALLEKQIAELEAQKAQGHK